MKRLLGLIAALALLTAGCGSSEGINDDPDTSEPATSTTATAPATSSKPTEVTLVIEPGAIGDAAVGMSKDEALATGLFEADTQKAIDGCPTPPLRWKGAFGDDVDVQTDETGTITSLGVRAEGVSTAPGIGVGSTYTELTEAYGDALTPPIEAGFGQSGVLLQSGEKYVGFLFDPPFDKLSTDAQDAKVKFIEVTSGDAPSLIRDGC